MARQGKIARLPFEIRRRINEDLLDNRTASEILEWLNADEAVIAILADKFEGEPVSPQNLSAWRAGGFADWLSSEERIGSIRRLADLAVRIAGADGASIAGGAASLVAGNILQALEGMEPGEAIELSDAVAKLHGLNLKERAMEHAARAKERDLALAERSRNQKDRELDLAENRVVARLLALARTDAFREILTSGQPDDVQMPLLRELMFGPVDHEKPAMQ